jgi:murein peptide amidase A
MMLMAQPAGPPSATTLVPGRSTDGRAIPIYFRGDPHASRRVLVIGCIHGNEPAGIRVIRVLLKSPIPAGTAVWLVPDLNPDGVHYDVRQNGVGTDLNQNFPTGWKHSGRPWSTFYSGPKPWSAVETRLVRKWVLAIRPGVTIWYHQHMDLVWAGSHSERAGLRYARAAGMRFYPRRSLPGSSSRWINDTLGESSFAVELPAGQLSPSAARRHAAAVLATVR